MNRKIFPDPRDANQYIADDIIALGVPLASQSLHEAYERGIYPWPIDGIPYLPWFCPEERGVLFFKDLKLNARLQRAYRYSDFRYSIDDAFDQVIAHCSEVPREPKGTWITEEMIEAYRRFHRLGYAHSVEAWHGNKLVGGLYGVEVKGCFAGESMFHLESNGSKFALLYLIDHLKKAGVEWIDIQMLTPHMEKLGAKLIPREEFLDQLERAQKKGLKPFAEAARTQR
ncbi:MAG: leucyl/phenylalanyl-tRNA--protein transferase [Bdellovibrionota bacterium]